MAGEIGHKSSGLGRRQMAAEGTDPELPREYELFDRRFGLGLKLTKPGAWPKPGLWFPTASRGVAPPLPSPMDSSATFLALCSANRFLISDGDSNFGFLAALAAALPGAGFPLAARRSASAWANCVRTRVL